MRRTEIPSLRDIKSIHSTGIRSIPKVQRSPYLELYTLSREKERLEKETFVLDKRRKIAGKQLKSINRRIGKLQNEISEKQKVKLPINTPPRFVKTIPIKY